MTNTNILAEERNSYLSNEFYDFIAGVNFIQVGFVTKVFNDDNGYALRCNARAFSLTPSKHNRDYYGLELLFPGTSKLGVRYPVEPNDCVLIIGTKFKHDTLVADGATEPFIIDSRGYSVDTLKALPLQPNALSASTLRIMNKDNVLTLESNVALKLSVMKDDNAAFVLDATNNSGVTLTVYDGSDAKTTLSLDKEKLDVNNGDVIIKAGEFNVFSGHLKVT